MQAFGKWLRSLMGLNDQIPKTYPRLRKDQTDRQTDMHYKVMEPR